MVIRVETRKKDDGLKPTVTKAPDSWDVGTFKQADKDQACGLVGKMADFFYPATPNLIPAPWPMIDPVPSVRDLDFGHVALGKVELKKLKSSQNWVRVDRLQWHLQNPGVRLHTNPLTSMPLVMLADDGPVIIDGHHSLGALLLLGADKVPVWTLPAPEQPKE